jgi:hypothetical protein
MQDTIITMYCCCDDFLKAQGHRDDSQCRMSTAEVMVVPLVACTFFGGNLALTRRFLFTHGYFRHDLSASRFCRRLHAINKEWWRTLFRLLGTIFVRTHSKRQGSQGSQALRQCYVIDSMPVLACDNIRIRRCKLFQGREYRGYNASKRRYFYGLKVHLLITGQGEPVEFVLTPGSTADVMAFKSFELELPPDSVILADKAYTDYGEEDLLREAAQIILQPQRKKNSKRPLSICREFLGKPIRQKVETAFSLLTRRFPRHIHAVTAQGFVLKVTCFLLAYSFQCL